MGKVTHFEIPADDTQRAVKFYEEIFGWHNVPMPQMSYTMVHTGPTDDQSGMVKENGFINGGIMERKDIKSPVVVIEVKSIDETLTLAESKGSQVIRPKVKVGEMGYVAYITDSEGNTIGIWENIG
jgi:predicted enzyme related to lactoylglutathione lyase